MALHSLGILSKKASWDSHLECFSSSVLKEIPHAERSLAAFPVLCDSAHPKPWQLSLGQVIVEARWGDEALRPFFCLVREQLHSFKVYCVSSVEK